MSNVTPTDNNTNNSNLHFCITCFNLGFPITKLTPWSTVLSWEAKRPSASQEIPYILWNMKVHYRIHNSPPSDPNLSQLHPVHVSPIYLLKIHFNITLSSTPSSSKWSLSLRSVHQNPICTSPPHRMCHMPPNPHLILFDLTPPTHPE
jgi:hypothetical protein